MLTYDDADAIFQIPFLRRHFRFSPGGVSSDLCRREESQPDKQIRYFCVLKAAQ